MAAILYCVILFRFLLFKKILGSKSHSTSFPLFDRVPYSPFFLGTVVLDHLQKFHMLLAGRVTRDCVRTTDAEKYVYGNVPVLPLLILYKYWNEKEKQFKLESERRKIVISRPIAFRFDGTKTF